MVDAQPDYSRLAELVTGLGLHEHLCLIYDTQEEQFAAALPYLKAGLERGEKCLYIVDESTAAAVLDALRKGGTDIDGYLRRGALTISHKQETYLQQGRFDPDWMIGFLTQATAEAGAAGFSGLRTVLGEMTWALESSDGTDKLLEYESKLNRFVRDHDARLICQYNRTRFSPELILGIIRTHPLLVYGGIVCKNPYYVPPEEFLKPNQASQEVERLLHNILTWQQAQQSLRDSEDRLRLVIDTVPALIHTGLPDGYLDFFNQRWLDYVGLSLEDLLGWKWTAAIHPEDVATMVEKWRAALATGEPYEHAARVRRADGEYRWMVHSEVPLRDERGNIVKWYASSIDIEDRKRAEMQSRALIDAIPQQIWSGPPDGTIDYCNDGWRSYMGLGLQDLQGDGWQTMLHPEDRDRVVKAWHESVVNGMPYEQVERHRGADGTYRWFLSRALPLRDAEGRIVRWYGTNTDIEDQKQADEELRQAEDRIRAILEFSPNWIFLKDTEGRYLLVNREVERVFRISQEQIKGKTDSEVFAPERAAEYRANDLKVVREGLTMEFEEIADLEDGPHTSIVHKFPLFDAHGNIYATGGVATDITDRKRAEAELRRSEAYLAEGQRLSHTGSWALNLSSRELYWSQETYRIFGFDPAKTTATLNETFLPRIHPEDRPRIEQGISAAAVQKKPYETDYRIVLPGGSIRYIHDVVNPVTNEADEVIERYGLVMDVTERKQAELTVQSLMTISQKLNSTLDVDTLMNSLILEAMKLTDSEIGWSGLTTKRGMLSTSLVRGSQVIPFEYRWPPGVGWPGWVLVHKVPYVSNDAAADTVIIPEIRKRWGVKSGIDAPILDAQGEVIGFFEVNNKRSGEYTDSDVEKMVAVSRIASVALQNALSFRKLRDAEESLRQLSDRLLQAQDEERRRIARELHDATAQSLAALAINLGVLRESSPGLEPKARKALADSFALVETCTREVRTISYLMHPPMLEELGLAAALRWYTKGFTERSGIPVDMEMPPELGEVRNDQALTLYRVVQESLTNVHRHSGSRRATIRLTREPHRITLSVADRGRGLPSGVVDDRSVGPRTPERVGVGIPGMRERVRQLGGQLEVQSGKNGTTVTVTLPFSKGG